MIGENYIKDSEVFRKDGIYFIDKMPNNFRHIGLIKLILPNAKIIDIRRNSMSALFFLVTNSYLQRVKNLLIALKGWVIITTIILILWITGIKFYQIKYCL